MSQERQAVRCGLFADAKARKNLPQQVFHIHLPGDAQEEVFESAARLGEADLPGQHKRVSGFVVVPLELREPAALAILASILTCTPGTAWVEYDSTANKLLIHVFDLVDEAHWIDLIKNRYERLLLEMLA